MSSSKFLKTFARRCFAKKGILKNYATFMQEKTCVEVSFSLFYKVAGFKPGTLLRKRL